MAIKQQLRPYQVDIGQAVLGRIIIKLDYEDNPHRNLVETGLLYCREGLLRNVREHMPRPMRRALDLTFIHTVLDRQGLTSGKLYLIEDVLQREFEKSPETENYYNLLDRLEAHAFFGRVVVPELRDYRGVSASQSKQAHRKEFDDFLTFADAVVRAREGGSKASLDHVKPFIRTGIIRIGIDWRLRFEGMRPYIRRIALCGDLGARTVYLIGDRFGAAAVPQNCERSGKERHRR